MGGLIKGCSWFFVITVAVMSAIYFPPLLFVVLVASPVVIIWNYLKRKGW
jgi:hypothetical protein